jgi:hypothetical protein
MFGNNQHGGKFYEATDPWNHHKGQFTKIVSTSTTSSKTFDVSNQDDEEKFEEGAMVILNYVRKVKKQI